MNDTTEDFVHEIIYNSRDKDDDNKKSKNLEQNVYFD
jgi:hypothetical protein